MTNESIERILLSLNENSSKENIFIRPISNDVYWGKVWPEDDITQQSYDFYFIKNPNSGFIGAVLDMGEKNLHWYILPEYRKNGYLTTALKNYILPHLFLDREKQYVECDNIESERVAMLSGFQEQDGKLVILKENVSEFKGNSLNVKYPISEESFKAIKNRIIGARQNLKRVMEELQIAYNTNCDCDMIIDDLNRFKMQVEDLFGDHHKESQE